MRAVLRAVLRLAPAACGCLHLDLLVLLSFSVSLAYFNHGRIYASTPLVYPPLVYLLVRMLALARVGRRLRPAPANRHDGSLDGLARPDGLGATPIGAPRPREAERLPPRLLIPAPWLAVGVVFLIGFRVALNVTDSNVIDVGYAGVIGAQRIVHDKPLYGDYPSDNEHGDTYGPVNYETYIPFQQLLGWSGRWDDLPAAHGAAIVFDLMAIALLFLLGRRVRGPGLGIALAYAWVSYPFTLFALESNSNDSLVAVLVLAALLVASSAPARGVFAALAGLTKLAPLALAPLLWTHGAGGLTASRRARALALFALAFVATAAVVVDPGAHPRLARTRSTSARSPTSQTANRRSRSGAYTAASDICRRSSKAPRWRLPWPSRCCPGGPISWGSAATAAAVLIAVQLGIDHWFYLYIPWFFGLVMLALLGQLSSASPPDPAVPSVSARSSQLAAA